jgi:hypothetical protein
MPRGVDEGGRWSVDATMDTKARRMRAKKEESEVKQRLTRLVFSDVDGIWKSSLRCSSCDTGREGREEV